MLIERLVLSGRLVALLCQYLEQHCSQSEKNLLDKGTKAIGEQAGFQSQDVPMVLKRETVL